ncbi:targeting protein for Xklp2 homolog isoform X1 [Zophobas morio]|uniref:targeting protein for Xklp2 homolog isoform X1 n=1 Tax=Zophobas morio TaxID=2755281 RepID=UPI003083BE93
MTEEFNYNANQYVDFNQADDVHDDSFFENNTEENGPHYKQRTQTVYEDVVESCDPQELSDTESDCFFSPMDTGPSNSTVYLKSKLRRSLSMGNLPTKSPPKHKAELSEDLNGLHLHGVQERPSSANAFHPKGKAPSQECINRLAQPKRFTSHENLTLAEAVIKFQAGTPKRFRSKPSPKINKGLPMPWGGTQAHSPKLKTTARSRPVVAVSKDEQERLEMEEAKKFKIKALPVSKKVLRGPLKPQLDKKPPTNPEPFHLTEIKKKTVPVQELKIPPFKAQPLPKSLHQPHKIHPNQQPPTKGQTPSFVKRMSRSTPNKVDQSTRKNGTPPPFRPSRTQPKPFSFEKRDQALFRKKEEQINKILEEEKKAREFHAKPPPKAILRSRNASQERMSEAGSVKSFKRSTEDLDTTVFKARPASVLMMKPFEPKRDETHAVRVEAFQFSTDQRLEARHKFEERLKEKEALMEAQKKQKDDMLKRLAEEEVAKLRKQMEYKAQPIKKYKELKIEHNIKVTEPISPKFHTDRIRNKENIQ